ncbi:MAG: hypothetical protein WDZ45_11215 [Flavobacteriaceae bacterium]
MTETGFIVFGRPVTHEFVSNGLFKELNLESETYLEFPNEFGLNKSIASITRQQLTDGTQVIKVYLFEYAESLNSRLGGFLGSGIAFRGIPSQKLLYTAFKNIHAQARILIDENRKFKKSTIDDSDIKLINPNTEGLIISNYNSKAEISTEKYGLKIDGPILLHIMSAVQGFMFNPNFKKIKTLYVSESKELLQQYVEPKKILSFGHLLNYEALHKAQHQKKASLDKELKTLSEEIKGVKKNIESGNNELKSISFHLKQKNEELNNLDKNLSRLKQQYDSGIHSIKNQEKNLEELKTQNYKNFQSLLTDRRFQQERAIYEKGFLEKNKELEKEIENKNKEIKHTKNRSGKRLLITGLVSFSLIVALFFIGSYYGKKQAQIQISEIPKPKPVKILETINAPETYPLSDFLKFPESKQDEHKKELDIFINKVSSVKKGDTSYDLSNFQDRKWHFAEIIDFNEESIDAGMERLRRIKAVLNRHEMSSEFFEEEYLLQNFRESNFETEAVDFNTSKRNEILKQYIRNDGNVYGSLELDLDKVSDFEKDLPLLYMHFRWMVYNLSSYKEEDNQTIQADILKTSQTKHTVLLKKQK